MIAAGRDEISISGEELQMNIGVVTMTPDGGRKIVYGVNTGVDLISEMTEYFGLGQRVE
jgi:hypothetical protein